MRITMIGTGYVGPNPGAGFADFGHEVVSLDKDPGEIERLNRGLMVVLRDVCRPREARAEGFDHVGVGRP